MQKVIILNKKEGETPLKALENFRRKHKEYKDVPMTYAGRLDPMASGILIILAGEETKNKEKYLSLDKEYEFEVLFGFATDTYDILGKINTSLIRANSLIEKGHEQFKKEIKNSLKYFKGEIVQTYPMYSSKTVNGRPLFSYARGGEEVEVPTRKVKIKKLDLIKIRKVFGKKLFENINKRINKVNGDFRQKEILDIWERELSNKKSVGFFVAKFKIKCSSGTYVRTIANSLGDRLKIPALAYKIRRTKIGRYYIAHSIPISDMGKKRG